DYRCLDVAEDTALRKDLHDNQVDYKVYNSSMTKRAIEGTELEGLSDTLAGPTAIAFGKEDVVLPAKILADFAKDHKDLEIKGGVMEGKVARLEEVKELSKLQN